MVRINYTRYNDGSGRAVLDLQVSTVAELPALNEELGMRLKVGAGSIAQVIQTGAWYTLDDNGTWYDTSGNEPSSESDALNASLSAPKNLGSIRDEQPIEEITEEPAEREEIPVKEQKKSFVESVEEPEQDGDDDERELL